jgi:hypothetical protein
MFVKNKYQLNETFKWFLLKLALIYLKFQLTILLISGLYYKSMTIVNDDSKVINKQEASLTDDAIVIIYDRHMFIVQATGHNVIKHLRSVIINCS